MIVREIENNFEEFKNFDYFNDYKDTRRFFVAKFNYAHGAMLSKYNEIIGKLDNGHEKWLKEYKKKISKRSIQRSSIQAGTTLKYLLNNYTRSELREFCTKAKIERGRNKEDAINSIVSNQSLFNIKLEIEVR